MDIQQIIDIMTMYVDSIQTAIEFLLHVQHTPTLL